VTRQNRMARVEPTLVALPHAHFLIRRPTEEKVPRHGQAEHRLLVPPQNAHVREPKLLVPLPEVHYSIGGTAIKHRAGTVHRQRRNRVLLLQQNPVQHMLHLLPLLIAHPPPHLHRPIGGPRQHAPSGHRHHRVHRIVVRVDRLQALEIRHAPHLHRLVPRPGVQQPFLLVQAESRNGVEMLHLHRVPVPANLHVILGVDGTLHVFFERRQAPDAFMLAWILGRDLPHPDLAVLVAGEDFPAGDYYGFNQSTAGFEAGVVLEMLPDSYILAVGAGV